MFRGPPSPFGLGTWWVDEIGGFHLAEGMDESLDPLFLKHFGQIKLVAEPDNVTVIWNVHLVAEDGLWAVVERLSGCGQNISIGLRYYYYGWLEESFTSSQAAIDRVLRVQQHRDVELVGSTFVRDQDIGTIGAAPPMVHRMFELWEQSHGRFDRISNEALADYLPRILIYRPDPFEEDLVFSWVGTRSFSTLTYGREWAISAFRQTYNRTLGPESRRYVDLACAAYRYVWETGEPHYAQVRALLTPKGMEPTWLCYERLLTRHVLHDGRPALVCLSRPAENIRISIAGGP